MGNSFEKEESASCCSSEESFWDFAGCSDSRRSSCSVYEKSPRAQADCRQQKSPHAAHANCRQQIKTLQLEVALERRHRLEAEETNSRLLAEVCQNLLQRVESEANARAATEAAIQLLALEVQVLGRRIHRGQDCDYASSICSSHIDVHSIADDEDSDSDLPAFEEELVSAPIQQDNINVAEEDHQVAATSVAAPIAAVEQPDISAEQLAQQDPSAPASRPSPDAPANIKALCQMSEQPCTSLVPRVVEAHGDSDSDGWSDDSDFIQ